MATKVSDLLSKARGVSKPKNTVAGMLRKAQTGPERIVANYEISGYNDEQQIVVGQVYAADTLDAHGHFMSSKELEAVAHGFMSDGLLTSIDVQHDNQPIDAVIVESFIARKNDPDFEAGSWVVSTKINDPDVWNMVKAGEINGYSFEILTYRTDLIVEIEFSTWYYGFTDPDPRDKHDHPFIVRLDENGEIIWGQTGLGSDGSPAHTISKSNVTDKVEDHLHRIHFKD